MDRYFCKKISPFWLDNRDVQARNDVRWRLGQETSLASPCSNLRSFRSKCTVLKKVLMTLLWLFDPCSHSVPRELCPLPSSLRPWWCAIKPENFSKIKKFSNPNVMNFYSMNICNFRTQYGMGLAQIAYKGYWRHLEFLRVDLGNFFACPTRFDVDLCLFCW